MRCWLGEGSPRLSSTEQPVLAVVFGLTVTLEYASEGRAVATGRPYGNHYISVVTIKDRKIIHWRDYLDPLRVFEARGVND